MEQHTSEYSTTTSSATTEAEATTTTEAEEVLKDDALFELTRGQRYALRRSSHYNWLHQAIMFLIILAGTAVATNIAAYPAVAFFIAALGIADVVFKLSEKACLNQSHYQQLSHLIMQLEHHEIDWQAADKESRRLQSMEGTSYWALEADCYNEALRTLGRDKAHLVPLSKWQRFTRHWLSHESSDNLKS